jgi:ligand-binding sensor domain-containing protein/signal transduction histidine kinase
MTSADGTFWLLFRSCMVAIAWEAVWLALNPAVVLASEPSQYTSRTWQVDEGLPHNTVQAIAQSREGYLWVGTRRGLARFDGLRFTPFEPQDTPVLKHANITALCQSREGTLWVGTATGGLVEIQGQHASHPTLSPDPLANSIECILQGLDGSLWVGTVGGLFRYRSGSWTRFTVQDGLSDNVVLSLCENEGGLWIGTSAGLSTWRDGVLSVEQPLKGRSIRVLVRDRQDRIWAGFGSGLACLERQELTFFSKKEGLAEEDVTTLREDRRGNLWIGSYGGLSRLTLGKFVLERDRAGSFYDQVNTIFEDQEGDIWVGTRDGLHRLRPRRILTYTRQHGLPHNNVTSVLEDHAGTIWVSTWGGGLVQMKDGQMTIYSRANGSDKGLANDLILSLGEDADGNLLVGTDHEGGAFRYREGKFSRFCDQEHSPGSQVIRVMHHDRAGNLWVGTSHGLALANSAKRYLPQAVVRCLAEDQEGVLWVGAQNGLFRGREGKFEGLDLPSGVGHETILALYADHENTLWIGTEQHGLGRWKEGRYTGYTTREGLWSDEIFEILEDDHGWLWMSCPRGIFRVSKANLAECETAGTSRLYSIVYDKAEGMESIQCSGVAKPAGCKGRDGRLWFATTKGLAVTDPNAEGGFNDKPPVVRIEEAIADQQSLSLGAATGNLRVAPGRGELEFHYTALSLEAPEKNLFRYKLSGVDPDWVEAGSRRVAYYNNLRPGKYEFRVIAANSDGVWNWTGAQLGVKLLPHFWQSKWFTGCVGLTMAGMLGGTVRYATKRKLRRTLRMLEELNAVEGERTRIARDMHDDLGARLTEILLLNELAKKTQDEPASSRAHLAKQAHVIQDVANSLNAIVWAVNPVNDSITHLADYLCEQVERLLSMRSIRCQFDVPAQIPDYSLSSKARYSVFLAVREALNNVVKHARASEVVFRLRTTPTLLSLSLQDNGRGFATAAGAGCGNGLQNMAKRMKHLGGSFHLSTGPGQGTCIRLEVPLRSNSLS